MKSEFFVKVVLSTIRSAYIESPVLCSEEDFFSLLLMNILDTERDLNRQEGDIEVSILTLKERDVSEEASALQAKKEMSDLDAQLLTCRREIYVCYKLLGDLVNAEYAPVQTALDIVSVLASLPRDRDIEHFTGECQRRGDSPAESSSSESEDDSRDQPLTYQSLARIVMLACGIGRRMMRLPKCEEGQVIDTAM
jgi:hypothetical protein